MVTPMRRLRWLRARGVGAGNGEVLDSGALNLAMRRPVMRFVAACVGAVVSRYLLDGKIGK